MSIGVIKPLFIVGHKRSKTTHLRHMLNMHRQIFISPESDILWLLYQYFNDLTISRYKYDGFKGMERTFGKYKDLFQKKSKPYEVFRNVLLKILEDATRRKRINPKENLVFIGDQKPFQNIDPKIVQFTSENFPSPSYLHIIRHPKEMIRSCLSFDQKNDQGLIWKGRPADQILKRWVLVEKWIERERSKKRHLIIDLRYEDVIENPRKEMARVFLELNLPCDIEVLNSIENSIVKPNKKNALILHYTQDPISIMNKYNYSIN